MAMILAYSMLCNHRFGKFDDGEISSWRHTNQEPIPTLVYPWYTNSKQNGKKDKMTELNIQELLISYMNYIHAGRITS